ncbi:UPF0057-domain-containing protein [Plenodomus tracheiphilus IPT5]|uniref:UPF0057-domain-containing protein n=1 Tax=Plenodomus tracheiphilus IPT5 TaxID=1408161 RepID=A0A6A7BCY8_9PLEO|nr:UPF0057-domain-containing protein [Plenodomus tracheiphilus IPT5]
MIKTIFLILITIFIPPLGVFLISGCGPDFLINILLTILGYFPGHIHAFYIEYVYFKRRDEVRAGIYNARPAPGVYSKRVQSGGHKAVPAPVVVEGAGAPVVVGGGVQQPAQQGYGTMR